MSSALWKKRTFVAIGILGFLLVVIQRSHLTQQENGDSVPHVPVQTENRAASISETEPGRAVTEASSTGGDSETHGSAERAVPASLETQWMRTFEIEENCAFLLTPGILIQRQLRGDMPLYPEN